MQDRKENGDGRDDDATPRELLGPGETSKDAADRRHYYREYGRRGGRVLWGTSLSLRDDKGEFAPVGSVQSPFVGMDLSSGPDMTAAARRKPDGGWEIIEATATPRTRRRRVWDAVSLPALSSLETLAIAALAVFVTAWFSFAMAATITVAACIVAAVSADYAGREGDGE